MRIRTARFWALALSFTVPVLGAYGCSEPTGQGESTSAVRPDTRPAPKAAVWVDGTAPEGTRIRLALADAVGSGTSRQGDLFRATMAEPLVVDGVTILPAGTVFQGIVSKATPAKQAGAGKGGSLSLSFRVVFTPIGASAPVAASLTEIDSGGAGGSGLALAQTGAGAAGATLLEARPGKEALLRAATPISIVLTEDLTIKVKKS